MAHVVWSIILASGKEEQLTSGVDTAFVNLNGRPVLSYCLDAFENCSEVDGIAVVCSKDRMANVHRMVQLFGCTKVRKIVAGKTQRAASLKAALGSLDERVSVLVVHDASRPLVKSDLIADTVKTAKRYGCAVAATKATDTIKLVPKGFVVNKTLEANVAWIAQTPIACRRDLFEKAMTAAAKKSKAFQDSAEAVEWIKGDVRVVPSSFPNPRVLDARDLELAEALVRL